MREVRVVEDVMVEVDVVEGGRGVGVLVMNGGARGTTTMMIGIERGK